jgi:hypothetical protein
MSEVAALEFDLDFTKVPVKLKNVAGDVIEYALVEMDGSSRDKYLDSLKDRVKTDVSGKPTGLKTFDGFEANLLKRCMRDSEGKLVEEKLIQSWPATVKSALFAKAQEINALDDKGAKEAKND